MNRIEGMLLQLMQQKPVGETAGPESPINVQRVAELLGISTGAVYQLKTIPRRKIHGRLRFFESEILAYINENSEAVAAPLDDTIVRRPRRNRRAITNP
jgi:predicted DNA-binding transcriptional regulator AlpA